MNENVLITLHKYISTHDVYAYITVYVNYCDSFMCLLIKTSGQVNLKGQNIIRVVD